MIILSLSLSLSLANILTVIILSLSLSLSLANILTVIILSQLVLRRQKSSYNYLLALAVADILVLLLIVFMDFLLEDFILARPLPPGADKALQVCVCVFKRGM